MLLEKLCRPTDSGVLRISSRQHVQIHFVTGSNKEYEVHIEDTQLLQHMKLVWQLQGRGFHATYEFVNELPTPPPISGFGEPTEVSPVVIQPKSGTFRWRSKEDEGEVSELACAPPPFVGGWRKP